MADAAAGQRHGAGVTSTRFRRIATALDGASEGAHMGHADFRVNGRIFASLDRDERIGSMKLSLESQAKFLAAAPDAFEPASGAWGMQGWTRVRLARADEEHVGEALTLAWQEMAVRQPARTRPAPKARTSKTATRSTASARSTTSAAPRRTKPTAPIGGTKRASTPAARNRAAATASADVDAYIAACPAQVRTILQRIREIVRASAPTATEVISYRMPAFTLDGALLYYAPFKAHIGIFPPIKGDAALNASLDRYRGPKGNLRFPLDEPMPYTLIRRLVRQRIAEHLAARAAKQARRR
ncbi:MAG: DUF1801 domain-containing protein [Vicinamibacterales bacterium]